MVEGIKQAGKILIEIVKNLKNHPLFLFGIASMLLSIISFVAIILKPINIPQGLTWFPYVLLIFGLLIIIFYPPQLRNTTSTLPLSEDYDSPNTFTKKRRPSKKRQQLSNERKAGILFFVLATLWEIYFGIHIANTLFASLFSSMKPESIFVGGLVGGLLTSLICSGLAVFLWFNSLDDENSVFPNWVTGIFGAFVSIFFGTVLSVGFSMILIYVANIMLIVTGNIFVSIILVIGLVIILFAGLFVMNN